MKPIPVQFHLGPLDIHTYGIGLAVTFWFAYRYFERRLAKAGFPTEWVVGFFLWVIAAAVIGARVLHVASMWGFYSQNPGDILAIWHGGLSSFGGIIFAVPVGVLVAHRACPQLRTARALDLVAPVLMAAWSLGRLLGPQLMVEGGGHPTHQWFGMYYADQAGARVPVPIFQSIGDFAIFSVLILAERRLRRWPDGSPRTNHPTGVVLGLGMVLWGIERAADQHLLLAEGGQLGSLLVQIAGVALIAGGLVLLLVARRRWLGWLAGGAPGGHGEAGTGASVAAGDNFAADPGAESDAATPADAAAPDPAPAEAPPAAGAGLPGRGATSAAEGAGHT